VEARARSPNWAFALIPFHPPKRVFACLLEVKSEETLRGRPRLRPPLADPVAYINKMSRVYSKRSLTTTKISPTIQSPAPVFSVTALVDGAFKEAHAAPSRPRAFGEGRGIETDGYASIVLSMNTSRLSSAPHAYVLIEQLAADPAGCTTPASSMILYTVPPQLLLRLAAPIRRLPRPSEWMLCIAVAEAEGAKRASAQTTFVTWVCAAKTVQNGWASKMLGDGRRTRTYRAPNASLLHC
jgi:hypothetical protein